MASALRSHASRLTLLASSPIATAPHLLPRRLPHLPRVFPSLTTTTTSSSFNTTTTTSNRFARYFSTTNSKMVSQLESKASYASEVIGKSDKLVVVDFFATWCGPCKAIAPAIEKLSKEYTDVDFYKLDVDAVSEVAAEVGVRAMPTFMFFKNGQKVGEVVGANPAAVKAAIDQHR